MPFENLQSVKLTQTIARQIELLILRGSLRPGAKLPPERDLAELLGVSQAELHEALTELETCGLITLRPGAGNYVADALGSAFSPALVALFAGHEGALYDYLAFRRDIEGLAAERAARYGTDKELGLINTIFLRMEAAHGERDTLQESALDAQFHMAIVEASHNVIVLHMVRAMFDMLRQGVFYSRQLMFRDRATRSLLLDQHREINSALQKRDATGAREAVARHLGYVEATLRDQAKAERQSGPADRQMRSGLDTA